MEAGREIRLLRRRAGPLLELAKTRLAGMLAEPHRILGSPGGVPAVCGVRLDQVSRPLGSPA